MIAVDPGLQRGGRGTALLRAIEEALRSTGQRLLLVQTSATLSPLVLWSDQRGAAILDTIDTTVLMRSGLPADPYFSASKMAWLCQEVPAVAAAARKDYLRLGTLDTFLVDRLGGPYRTDLSTASRTQLLALGGTD